MMVGGDEAAVERCRPLFDEVAGQVFHLGAVGAGQIAKVVNNAIKIGILSMTTEGLSLGARAGLDTGVLLDVLRASSADSHVVQEWDHYYGYKKRHQPGGPLDILYKDIGFALALADELGVDLPMTKALADIDVGRLVG
jgi:3-hydroxyisobutyrate dehydrogenase